MIVKPLEWIEDGKILHGEVVCEEHSPVPLQFVISVPVHYHSQGWKFASDEGIPTSHVDNRCS